MYMRRDLTDGVFSLLYLESAINMLKRKYIMPQQVSPCQARVNHTFMYKLYMFCNTIIQFSYIHLCTDGACLQPIQTSGGDFRADIRNMM